MSPPAPPTPDDRMKQIQAHEKSLLSLKWDRSKYPDDVARAAARLMAVMAFLDPGVDSTPPDSPPTSSGSGGGAGGVPAADAKRGPSAPAPSGGGGERRPSKRARRTAGAPLAPKTQVACRGGGGEWVVGRVKRYIPESQKYEVADEDETYTVARKNVRTIPRRPPVIEEAARVLAVYPATTVFYPARLVGKGSPRAWQVAFDDEDEDEADTVKDVRPTFVMLP